MWSILSTPEGRVLVLVIGGVLLFLLISWFLRQQRSHEWQRLARKHGLHFQLTDIGPHVSGKWQGRPIEVRTSTQSSDSAEGLAVTVLEVALSGPPPSMVAEGNPGVIGELADLSEERVTTGDPLFDKSVHLIATDATAALTYWTPQRRHLFTVLATELEYDRLVLSDTSLKLATNTALKDYHQLEQILHRLAEAANQLEA